MKKPCCEVSSNLEVKEESEERVMVQCSVCGARHYSMRAKPGHVGATLSRLGRSE